MYFHGTLSPGILLYSGSFKINFFYNESKQIFKHIWDCNNKFSRETASWMFKLLIGISKIIFKKV